MRTDSCFRSRPRRRRCSTSSSIGNEGGHVTNDHGSGESLTHSIGLTDENLAARKAFLELGPADEERLRGLRPLAEKYATPIVEDLYKLFLAHEPTKSFFTDPKVLEHV